MTEQNGCVYLVGAGCGPADWITVQGQRLLMRCDAVVYDDLIDPALLALAPPSAALIPVGKRCGRHSVPQAQTNQILIAQAGLGRVVVRLKGGDPFVFGRGGEEIEALQQAGVPYAVVPGISSAVAIPGAAGIPVTHRRLSRSFHVITAHTAEGDGAPGSLDALARLDGTLVFLMGLARLAPLATGLMAAGRAPDTPAAVVSGGNAPCPCTVRGTLADIAAKADAARVQPPAVIVVGAVAALDFAPALRPPLPDGPQAWGAAATAAPRTAVTPATPAFAPGTLADGAPHWIVLTSANVVRGFWAWLRAKRLDVRRLHACRFAVADAAAKQALEDFGICPDLRPQQDTGEGLGRALCAAVAPGEDVFLFCLAESAPVLNELLTRHNIPCRNVPMDPLAAGPAAPAGGLLL